MASMVLIVGASRWEYSRATASDIGKRIRRSRLEQGLTQHDVVARVQARDVAISQSTLHRIEEGEFSDRNLLTRTERVQMILRVLGLGEGPVAGGERPDDLLRYYQKQHRFEIQAAELYIATPVISGTLAPPRVQRRLMEAALEQCVSPARASLREHLHDVYQTRTEAIVRRLAEGLPVRVLCREDETTAYTTAMADIGLWREHRKFVRDLLRTHPDLLEVRVVDARLTDQQAALMSFAIGRTKSGAPAGGAFADQLCDAGGITRTSHRDRLRINEMPEDKEKPRTHLAFELFEDLWSGAQCATAGLI